MAAHRRAPPPIPSNGCDHIYDSPTNNSPISKEPPTERTSETKYVELREDFDSVQRAYDITWQKWVEWTKSGLDKDGVQQFQIQLKKLEDSLKTFHLMLFGNSLKSPAKDANPQVPPKPKSPAKLVRQHPVEAPLKSPQANTRHVMDRGKEMESVKLKSDIQMWEKRAESWKKEKTTLKSTIEKLTEEKKAFQARLSEKVFRGVENDSCFEDVSSIRSPLALRDRFEEICSEEWVDAKDKLDEQLQGLEASEAQKCRFLCSVFQTAMEQAENKRQAVMREIMKNMEEMLWAEEETPGSKRRSIGPTARKQAENLILDFLLSTSDKMNVGQLTEEVSQCALEDLCDISTPQRRLRTRKLSVEDERVATMARGQYRRLASLNTGRSFVQSVCKLAWTMAVQKTPVRFSVDGVGKPLNPETQTPNHASNPQREGNVVLHYIYPALVQGDRVLAPGKVYVGQPRS